MTHPAAPGFRSIHWHRQASVAVSESPFSFQQKVYDWGGKIWIAEVALPEMVQVNAKLWRGFFAALNGPEGTFYLKDSLFRGPCAEYMGYPYVNGAGQTGETLITDGWRASAANVMRAGEWLSIGDNLYQCVQDADSNSSGGADIEIWPSLRFSPADDTAVEITEPRGIFRLSEQVSMGWGANWLSEPVAFTAREVPQLS